MLSWCGPSSALTRIPVRAVLGLHRDGMFKHDATTDTWCQWVVVWYHRVEEFVNDEFFIHCRLLQAQHTMWSCISSVWRWRQCKQGELCIAFSTLLCDTMTMQPCWGIPFCSYSLKVNCNPEHRQYMWEDYILKYRFAAKNLKICMYINTTFMQSYIRKVICFTCRLVVAKEYWPVLTRFQDLTCLDKVIKFTRMW